MAKGSRRWKVSVYVIDRPEWNGRFATSKQIESAIREMLRGLEYEVERLHTDELESA